jgi:hypothetical protein
MAFSVGIKDVTVAGSHGFIARDAQYNLLAEYFKKHINIGDLISLIKQNRR